jgi:glutamate synthase (NADPH) small chain
VADPKGFITTPRETPKRRPVDVRLQDWREVYESFPTEALQSQAGRCMDCGIPFCHNGCPLGNLIPEWNDLVWRDEWPSAVDRLHATNNFPEFTGRLCPAPCETACVVGISGDPVSIKQVEVSIAERGWDDGLLAPQAPSRLSDFTVAVVGSGPAGLAAAQQLARAGHTVAVYERADRIGGLLRYGIPEFKMEKSVIDRRLAQLTAEGVKFRPGVEIGVDINVVTCNRDMTSWCWPLVRRNGATCRYQGASSVVSIRRWSTCPLPTECSKAISTPRRSTPKASTSSSSAVATLVLTVLVPRTDKEPRR